jgi:methionine sulfoxide reductase heme-binding subunit
VSQLLAAASPSAYWYLTRGSGVVALLLLTASICLGIATTMRWQTTGMPRFAVTGLHRTVTLVAIAFVALHVATTVLDGYAPVGWKDAVLPFLSPYRPVWLGLGAVAFDLLLALVITSLLRARLGYRLWRATHWLAYASWPVALVHALGTGSDARFGWLQAIAAGCTLAVVSTLALRLGSGPGARHRRLAGAAATAGVLLAVGMWYRSGPAVRGWAARAGTPASLVAHSSSAAVVATTGLVRLPHSFRSHFSGQLTAARASAQLVDIRIDGTLTSSVKGRLRLVLEGVPLEEGGVSMTASGVALGVAGSPSVYEGRITGLDGRLISARVSDGSKTFDLRIALQLQRDRTQVSGLVSGVAV